MVRCLVVFFLYLIFIFYVFGIYYVVLYSYLVFLWSLSFGLLFSYLCVFCFVFLFFFFKQKTAYEMRISDWSADVCSSDLTTAGSAPTGRWRRCCARTASRHSSTSPATISTSKPRCSTWPPAMCCGGLAAGCLTLPRSLTGSAEIGRASCRERGGQLGEMSVVAVSLKKKKK